MDESNLISDEPVDWSRYEKADGSLVGSVSNFLHATEGKPLAEKNYALPEGYTYLFGLNAGKGMVALVEGGDYVIDAVYRLETEAGLSEALTRLTASAAARVDHCVAPFRERAVSARSIEANLALWLEENKVPFKRI